MTTERPRDFVESVRWTFSGVGREKQQRIVTLAIAYAGQTSLMRDAFHANVEQILEGDPAPEVEGDPTFDAAKSGLADHLVIWYEGLTQQVQADFLALFENIVFESKS
jgi:hypothetical protein